MSVQNSERQKRRKKAGKRANNEGTISQRSDGRWEAKITIGYDDNGKLKRKSLYGKSQREVEEKLTEFKARYRSGNYIEPASDSFGTWLLQWLKSYKEPVIKPETYADYVDLAEKHILPVLGHVSLDKLHNITIQEFINLKAKSGRLDGKDGGLSARRLHMLHQLINGALKKAVKSHMIPFNPAEDIELPVIDYEEFQTFSIEEVDAYLQTLREDRLYALFLLELTTGLRKGELLGIPKDRFNANAGELEIVQTIKRKKLNGEEKSKLIFSTPKTKKSRRTIPLLPKVVKEIKKFQAVQLQEKLFFGPAYRDSGLLFTTPTGTPLEPRNLNRKHGRIIEKAGLKYIRVHDLRHTVATLILDSGENIANVSGLLGHAKKSTTVDIYDHDTTDGKKGAVACLGNILKAVQ